jgi:hypothetical protein
MKYIFVAGAPGSKWSSVVKNIYFSPSIDHTDHTDERTYIKDGVVMHMGAYWDPGMEFDLPESLSTLTKKQAEEIFDSPFSGKGIRIIKSHIFSYQENIDYLKELWPESPIVLVHRSDDSCLGWWVKSGHFTIAYPNYSKYYVDLKTMAKLIARQNSNIKSVWEQRDGFIVYTNHRLALMLGISSPPPEYNQNYTEQDIEVKVI